MQRNLLAGMKQIIIDTDLDDADISYISDEEEAV